MPDLPGNFSSAWLVVLTNALAFVICLLASFSVLCWRPPTRRTDPEDAALDGIGGWLILVSIGAATRIYYYGKTLYIDLDLVFSPTRWNALTLPGGRLYDPFWFPSLLFESSASLVLMMAVILSFILLVQKRFTYPFVMIGIFVGSFVFHVLDHLLVHQVRVVKPNDTHFALLMLRLIVASVIWIPYFLVSKRVKATFRR